MEIPMKRSLIVGTMACWAAFSTAQAAQINPGAVCTAKVVQSEELPYAPIGSWLVRVTLQVIPLRGPQFLTTLEHSVPWQRSAPRRGEIFRVRCDPANALIY
jgi:hypothetical protein